MAYQLKTNREPKACIHCGEQLPLLRHYKKNLCDSCKQDIQGLKRSGWQAHRMVALAVRLGYLPKISSCVCVECGAPATDYEHRDYSKPLDVEPVCRTCNFARTPAAHWVSPFADKHN